MKQLSVGDKFWLLPAPINPIMILVEVQEVTPNGYLVDEPVGVVSNENCMFLTRDEAEKTLIKLFNEGVCQNIPELHTHDLDGTRKFLIQSTVNMRHRKDLSPQLAYTTPLKPKEQGKEWFKIEDLKGNRN